ncbi:hypothetical protein PIROE2DRAFT_64133 [Piromyces sp. E2]|nr:hypothetical protein PIROE2DRAFT_64133 [Piromyces sp. E2]|eukprot:OUM58878.1 hypothetical protein PIROE2DRAFT_64133 [Piromyces sp. E2]
MDFTKKSYIKQNNEEIIDENSDIDYDHTHLINKIIPKRFRNSNNNSNNSNLYNNTTTNNNNNNNNDIDTNSDNSSNDYHDKNSKNKSPYNRIFFRGLKNNYNNISSLDTFSIAESEEDKKKKKKKKDLNREEQGTELDLEKYMEEEFDERERRGKNNSTTSELDITFKEKAMNTFHHNNNYDEEQVNMNRYNTVDTVSSDGAYITPKTNSKNDSINIPEIHITDSSNTTEYDNLSPNENTNNYGNESSDHSSDNTDNNNNNNNFNTTDINNNHNLRNPILHENSSIISNPFKDKSINNSTNNVFSNPFTDSNEKNNYYNKKPFSNPFKDSSDSSENDYVNPEIYPNQHEINTNLMPVNDIVDEPPPMENDDDQEDPTTINKSNDDHEKDERSLKFNLAPDIIKKPRATNTGDEENFPGSNLKSNYGSVETNSSAGRTKDVSSVTTSLSRGNRICTDKCVHAVCGHYTCLSMYDNIKEDDESLSIVFLHNLKSLFDYRPTSGGGGSSNSGHNNNNDIINGINDYMNGNYNKKNKNNSNSSSNSVLFKHKNSIQPRSINYTNLNKVINYNKTNYVVYNNDIVVEYNENPRKEIEHTQYSTGDEDENKIINIGILVDDDYVYEQMNSSNNYEISVDNYTYKFVQNGDSITQQQALYDPNEMPTDIFDTDICTEIGKVEIYVDVCYISEAIILFIFTLIIIKIIHYKKLTVSDEMYEDSSEFGSNSIYSVTSGKNGSLPSVVNNPYNVIIYFYLYYIIIFIIKKIIMILI